MPFENATTYVSYVKKGKVDEFNKLYEDALKDSEKYMNREYSNFGEIMENKKLKPVSPVEIKTHKRFQAVQEIHPHP